MRGALVTPLEIIAARAWSSVDVRYRRAFFAVLLVNLLAHGFQMTNLILHHDDVGQFFITENLGRPLGRYGFGWIHANINGGYYVPLLQTLESVVFMTLYGLIVCYLWGIERTIDATVVAGLLCVYPYIAQVYSYDTSMAPVAIAHACVAGAALLGVRGTIASTAAAAALYLGAFAIYQSVAANAATVFLFWLLGALLYRKAPTATIPVREIARPLVATLIAVIAGGVLYFGSLRVLGIEVTTSYQNAGEAFDLTRGYDLARSAEEILHGTRKSLLWPENYFPLFLKRLQLALIAASFILAVWMSSGFARKLLVATVFAAALIAPRSLQLLHPDGDFHNLTMTAYAVVVAGALMLVVRSNWTPARNLALVAVIALLFGYVVQCNWIATVNHLNNVAHVSTMTQILARLKALPVEEWDGKHVLAVGGYRMRPDYPFEQQTGVAVSFIDSSHIDNLARLLREDVVFVSEQQASPTLLAYANNQPPWPLAGSISTFEGHAVLVLSHDRPNETQSRH